MIDRWKVTSGLGVDADKLKQLDAAKVYVYLEFNADGTARIGSDSFDLTIRASLMKGKDTEPVSMKFRVVSGDRVEFYDFPKESASGVITKGDGGRATITVQGDVMNVIFSDNKVGTPHARDEQDPLTGPRRRRRGGTWCSV